MKVPDNAIIPDAKMSSYLLVLQPRNDKSKFLAQAGFTQNNVDALADALRQLVATNEAIENRTDEYGTYYQVIGRLSGVNGINLSVVTVWLRRNTDQNFQFITLIPVKEINL
ncbi:hypothetical protein IQ241_20980 [Romeria aff. gracilis LEGE 07310]|uniref:DUF6883 domain-containing protein n=1 Tax=Vasconcelosia minhoensis LEGE 07310 TaxID=915328 RepID=A0A8J7AB91_9CYAN|nr:hypothetical protein [Romeria aff. gracilis LEGE 07310]